MHSTKILVGHGNKTNLTMRYILRFSSNQAIRALEGNYQISCSDTKVMVHAHVEAVVSIIKNVFIWIIYIHKIMTAET